MANFYDVALRFPRSNKVGQLRIEANTPEQVREITSLMFPGATLQGYESLSLSALGQSDADLNRLYKKIHNGTIAEINPKELSAREIAMGTRFGGPPLDVMNLTDSNSIIQSAGTTDIGIGGADPLQALRNKWQGRISPEAGVSGFDRWSNDLQAMIDQEAGAGATFEPDQIQGFKDNQDWVQAMGEGEDLSKFKRFTPMSDASDIGMEEGWNEIGGVNDAGFIPGATPDAPPLQSSFTTDFPGDMPGITNAQARYLKEQYFVNNPDMIGTVHGHIMGIHEFNSLPDDDKMKYGWRREGDFESGFRPDLDGSGGNEIINEIKRKEKEVGGEEKKIGIDEATSNIMEKEAELSAERTNWGEAMPDALLQRQLEAMSPEAAFRRGLQQRFGDLPTGSFRAFMERQASPYAGVYTTRGLAGLRDTEIPTTFQDYVSRTDLPTMGRQATEALGQLRGYGPMQGAESEGLAAMLRPQSVRDLDNAMKLLTAAQQAKYSPMVASAFNPRGIYEEDLYADYLAKGGGMERSPSNFLEFASGRYGL